MSEKHRLQLEAGELPNTCRFHMFPYPFLEFIGIVVASWLGKCVPIDQTASEARRLLVSLFQTTITLVATASTPMSPLA